MIGLSLDHGKKYKVPSVISVDSKERKRLGVRKKRSTFYVQCSWLRHDREAKWGQTEQQKALI